MMGVSEDRAGVPYFSPSRCIRSEALITGVVDGVAETLGPKCYVPDSPARDDNVTVAAEMR